MNYLAHIYLSHQDEQEMLGNFSGDYIKGKKYLDYPASMGLGALLHRYIDSYTDQHPATKRAVVKLRPYAGRYSGAVIDVFYDHFLARDFEQYHSDNLLDFTRWFYAVAQKRSEDLPTTVQGFLPHMAEHNWLIHYQSMYGVERAMGGLERRSKGLAKVQDGAAWLQKSYTFYEACFEELFPDLLVYSEEKREVFQPLFK